jgi:hypothetical protein
LTSTSGRSRSISPSGVSSSLPHDHAGGQVGEPQRVVEAQAVDQGGGQSGVHRVAGSRDVIDFAGDRRVVDQAVTADAFDPLVAAGDDQESESITASTPVASRATTVSTSRTGTASSPTRSAISAG